MWVARQRCQLGTALHRCVNRPGTEYVCAGCRRHGLAHRPRWMAQMTVKDLWGLAKAAASGWVDDYAQSMGAALAYYTMFSIAPLLLIVISIAGLVFGDQAARGEIFSQLEGMLGAPGALAVQGLLESVSKPTESVTATVFGVVLLLI